MIEWDQWQTLLAIFRNGSFSKAAKVLKVDATTVGRRLKILESNIGSKLFLRKDGKLYPSSHCETLLAHIEAASEALRAAEHESASSESGAIWRDLRLTAPPFLVRHLLAPQLNTLTQLRRIRIEFLSTTTTISLSRREADIALRIDDRPPDYQFETDQIETEWIGDLTYAIYCKAGESAENLPWAGLREEYVRSSGNLKMIELAGGEGFRFRAFNFDALTEITACGAARTMLPCFCSDPDSRLQKVSDIVLTQPLWMQYHRQDRDIAHLSTTRDWIRGIIEARVPRS